MLCLGPTVVGHGSGSLLRHLRNRELDSVISAASAKIPAKAMSDLFRRRIGMFIKNGLEGDDKPGRAESALRSIVVDECLLYWVEGFALHQRLDRCDGLSL